MTLRPSALPKLAECPCFEGDGEDSAAAARGTALDASFRHILSGAHVTWAPDANVDDIASVEWAIQTCRLFAGGSPIQANEDDLRVEALGMSGTADAACPEKLWSADLKTGQIRNYREQQAEYALGFMEREFCDSWTVHLLFCDERQVITLEFTREEAEKIVRGVLAKVHDGNKVPAPNDYCGWCKHRYTCIPRLELVAWWIGKRPDELDLPSAFSDPVKLASLLEVFYDIGKDDGLLDEAKRHAKDHMLAKREVSGWKMQTREGSEYVDSVTVGRYAAEIGFQKLVAAYGNLTGKKFRDLWASTFPDKPFPQDVIGRGAGSVFVARATRSKKPKA